MFSGFLNLETRWHLQSPQGKGKTSCYQPFHPAFHFLIFKYAVPFLPMVWASWRQCEQPIKQASSTSLPLGPLLIFSHFQLWSPSLLPTNSRIKHILNSNLNYIGIIVSKHVVRKEQVNLRENKSRTQKLFSTLQFKHSTGIYIQAIIWVWEGFWTPL